jgi:uncharacterized short protein YbdD (DUF466 family)
MSTLAQAQSTLRHFWRQAVRTARLSIGVADYDTYVRHLRTHQQARYKNGGNRGCC